MTAPTFWHILYLFNISMMLNKWIIRWFWVNVTTKALPICLSKYTTTTSSNIKCRLWLTFFDVPFLIYFNIFGVMYQKKQDRFATCFKTCGKNSWGFVVTSTQNHPIKHLYNIIEILFLFKIFEDHRIKKFDNNIDLNRKLKIYNKNNISMMFK